MEDYRALLERIDAWYRGVKAAHPEKVPCARGCRDCCLGLFDITPADRDLLREGLTALDESARNDIRARADAILGDLRGRFPDLGDTLDGWTPDDIDDLCDVLGDVECPVLGTEGECRLYAYRPMTCRMSGVPVVDLDGERVFPEGCSKCTLSAAETPRLDCGALWKEERRLLRKRYPGKSGVVMLIPQAVGTSDSGA